MTIGKWRFSAVLACVTAAMCAMPAFAHHSMAMYDLTKPVTIAATVSVWKWANPHTTIVVVAHEPKKTPSEVQWDLEGPAVSFLSRLGWHRNDINVGDKVKITFYPRLDGSLHGSFTSIELPDGRLLKGPGSKTQGAEGSKKVLENPLEVPQ